MLITDSVRKVEGLELCMMEKTKCVAEGLIAKLPAFHP